ncbi:MAG: GNAT family N-acetyltransferase [Candidatus Bathyarchaeota archaeon]|nr:MAG: GNAT family N-acetyltransferase [Candidatus Bathyarchaeota archaeon]
MKIETDEISYRRASIDDVEALMCCRVRFLNELHNHPDDEQTEFLRKSLRQYFYKAITSNDFVAWVAEHNEGIIGTGGMVVWQRPSNYGGLESGKLGYLLNFYTIPEARRKGICTRLLNELIKEARLTGLRYLHLNATKDGIRMYRKAGFAEPDDTELELRLEYGILPRCTNK